MADADVLGDTMKRNATINKAKDKKFRPVTKVIIRRLPPDISKSTFMEQISPVPAFDYMYLIKGDSSLGEYAFSRAYINFLNIEDIFIFKEKFDNYVFIDQKGHEYAAVVEFAAFQKIPKKRRVRPDPKCGTIESDPYFQEFLLSLNEQPSTEEKPEYSYQFTSESREDSLTTPLLEYVKQKKVDRQRIREERRDERRRKEIERKKFKEEERKKLAEEKSKFGSKSFTSRGFKTFSEQRNEKISSTEVVDENNENNESTKKSDVVVAVDDTKPFYKNNRKVFNPDKGKSTSYCEGKDLKFRKDEYKNYSRDKNIGSLKKNEKYEYNKKNTDFEKPFPKKVKKYSAIREERKIEFKKQEQKKSEMKISEELKDMEDKDEDDCEKQDIMKQTLPSSHISEFETKATENRDSQSAEENSSHWSPKEKELKNTNKENDPRTQRRIRNKDRPTMAIYQPGMLSKRKQSDGNVSENGKTCTGENKPNKEPLI